MTLTMTPTSALGKLGISAQVLKLQVYGASNHMTFRLLNHNSVSQLHKDIANQPNTFSSSP